MPGHELGSKNCISAGCCGLVFCQGMGMGYVGDILGCQVVIETLTGILCLGGTSTVDSRRDTHESTGERTGLECGCVFTVTSVIWNDRHIQM